MDLDSGKMTMDVVAFDEYAPAGFYRQKIIDAANALSTGSLMDVGQAVFSFYSGRDYEAGKVAELSWSHIKALFLDPTLSVWCARNPQVVLRWVEASYFYFRSMAAIPELAREVWSASNHIVERFSDFVTESFSAASQMATWDYFYGKQHHPACLYAIKKRTMPSPRDKAYKALYLSTIINKGRDDFSENIVYAYKKRAYLSHVNLALAVLNYYCEISKAESYIDELLRILKGKTLRQHLAAGNTDFLKPLMWVFYDENRYSLMLRFLRVLKDKEKLGDFTASHAFLLANGDRLSIMTSSWRDEFPAEGNYETYKKLIQVSNCSVNTAISLLGEEGILGEDFDSARRGAPPVKDDLSALADATIAHFKLANPIYSEINSLTLVPSHNFPIQSSLFRLSKPAPVVSVSLEDILDDPEDRHFVFFLSSHTVTVNVEEAFIRAEFGEDAEIFIDPSVEQFLSVMKEPKYTHIYISAHGEYDHWGGGVADEIQFSGTSKIGVDVLRQCKSAPGCKRNIILNICDGATSAIDCVPYQRGLASSLASGSQTVISHLWPVHPIYACAFGVLSLHFLKAVSAIDAARQTFGVLDREHDQILVNIERIAPSFSVLKGYLKNVNFNMQEFKNIGSVAVYS
ncbi:hypothetical protein [Pseudomonas wadenswilerensis]|uniref:hypothetical protein n=1 Tax=Pseudomonas wadenswilerensis TaxID=1785161 RepID=UPI0021610AF4|nr:hypothetical protein [Pseudomonas wadenswilerensis]UVM19454.1 hypothetical protein LOY45_13330 [Pseudomonas wadenswilerensis]